jgi:tight adherence protein B
MIMRAVAGWLVTVVSVAAFAFMCLRARYKEKIESRLEGLRPSGCSVQTDARRGIFTLASALDGSAVTRIACFASCSVLLYALSGSALGILLALPLAFALPRLLENYRNNRKNRLMREGIGDFVDAMTQSLEGGYSVRQALEFAAEDVRPPLRYELQRAVADITLGKDLAEAFSELGKRIGDPELSVMIEAVLLLKQAGGNLPEVLRRLREIMRQRDELSREMRVFTVQGRWSGYIVSSLPVVFLCIEAVFSPATIGPLFKTTTGLAVLLTGLSLEAAGFFCIRRICRLERPMT